MAMSIPAAVSVAEKTAQLVLDAARDLGVPVHSTMTGDDDVARVWFFADGRFADIACYPTGEAVLVLEPDPVSEPEFIDLTTDAAGIHAAVKRVQEFLVGGTADAEG